MFTPGIHSVLQALAGSPEAAFKWFMEIFPRIPEGSCRSQMHGEATPMYIDEAHFSPAIMKEHLPSAKIILLLREPVSKLRSMAGFRRDQVFVNVGTG